MDVTKEFIESTKGIKPEIILAFIYSVSKSEEDFETYLKTLDKVDAENIRNVIKYFKEKEVVKNA